MKTLPFLCFVFLVSPIALFAQLAAWTPVQALGLGSLVEVKAFSRGGVLRGSVEQVTDDTLVVRHKRGVATFSRSDVRRVRSDPGRKSKFGQILAPTVAGSIALNASTPRWNRGTDVAYMVGVGYLFGWGLDGLINDHRRKTIYKAPAPPKK